MEKKWLIWSIEHGSWWNSHERGYVTERSRAGLYTYADALNIVKNANIGLHDVPNEAMVEASPEEIIIEE